MKDLSYQLLYMLTALWRRRYMLFIPLIILPLVGAALGLTSAKRFESHTSMLIQETSKMNPFLEDFAVSAMLKERLDSLETLLHSRHILGAVAQELDLVDAQTLPDEYERIISTLSASLTMSLAGKDLIRIEHSAGSPSRMKETLETVSRHFIEQLLAPERSSMTDSAFFLEGYLETRHQELKQAEQALAEFKGSNSSNLPYMHSANITRLAQLKLSLAEKMAQQAGAQKSLGGLNQQLSKTNPIIGKIEDKIIKLLGNLALLKARYTDQHSKVKAINRELNSLELERQALLSQQQKTISSDALWDMASAATVNDTDAKQPLLITQLENLQQSRTQLDFLTEEINSLQTMIASIEQRTAQFGAQQQTLQKLERDFRIKQELYEELLHRYEMARMTQALGLFEQNKRIKIIDLPFTPVRPSNFPLFVYLLAGAVAGLSLGGGLSCVFALTDNTVYRRDELERLTGIPVLSRIPSFSSANAQNVARLSGGKYEA
ncbi:chain-length determining protein [Psychrobium sp. 1_MG-2023]|uniref:chain-length determining protein n=1 Tax=Psychrobium sp. 1_MG-2023 TaxID=3062624 RepID=UPI000C343EE3|nr:chain-length determining protein [Psychrobium sp. 1_MG-2023]MDP2561331.1 chain-length determining protein [Psychrobium sp. 1_MG-2023]PKF54145.1 chain-length determining protein [Alteromonadales bacterium alter-6D02]